MTRPRRHRPLQRFPPLPDLLQVVVLPDFHGVVSVEDKPGMLLRLLRLLPPLLLNLPLLVRNSTGVISLRSIPPGERVIIKRAIDNFQIASRTALITGKII